jgi:hypothetical protein
MLAATGANDTRDGRPSRHDIWDVRFRESGQHVVDEARAEPLKLDHARRLFIGVDECLRQPSIPPPPG